MVKDTPTQTGKNDKQQPQDKNIVDKILKNKNRFRSGLGFKQGRSNKEEEKARISQTVSRKKILQGTKADKVDHPGDDDRGHPEVREFKSQIEIGNRNYFAKEDADENTTLSQQATLRKSKYWDPKKAFLEMIEKEGKQEKS